MAQNLDPCPLCKRAGVGWMEKNGYVLLECLECKHRYFIPPDPDGHVKSVYSDQYFKGSSEGYVDYFREEAIQRASARNYVARLRQHVPASARVLDVGAACGFFLKEFQEAGWHGLGLEPNASMRALGQERLKVNIVDGSISQLPREDTFDLISIIQVISHLVDPVEMVEHAYSKLATGGHLLIETWDRESLAARLFGSKWHELNPPSVLHWFSRASLRGLICDVGFDVVESGLPLKRIQLGRAFSILRHSASNSILSRCLTLPLMFVPERISLPYLLGDAFWMLFKKRG